MAEGDTLIVKPFAKGAVAGLVDGAAERRRGGPEP
jgi:hypothetical protein